MQLFGGGSPAPAPAPQSASGTQTAIQREAPEIEARKLALYDEAIELARQPLEVPEYQVAGPSPLEQQAFQMAGQTGQGTPAATAGIASILSGNLLAAQQPDIDAFMNPYQRYVVDEVNRQSAMKQNQMAAQAVQAGAFGGGREGVQRAEEEGRRLGQIGQLQAAGFQQALGAAQTQQKFQTDAALSAGQALLGAGAQQQAMQQSDIAQLGQAGGLQRQIADRALAAQRQTEVARQYEPFQRMEFAKGIMTTLPTAASTITQTTGPGVNPFAQALGTGVTAYSAYQMMQPGQQKGTGGVTSDKRLKKNIKYKSKSKHGYNIYEFEYTWSPQRYTGVMAQEVEKVKPSAVSRSKYGYMMVDYDQLDVNMERV
tara:strand:- start:164 stop:1276 length:1113 start_codon:yes stop_codon:yes gene_type:complete